ncbi:trypsin-like serine peptidase [Agromyces flavus]|uniref:trypsin-like serine peptidase n=1 Tax=Agromyces flavus TaxID=589382 RepID=UPI00361734DF
MGPGLVLTAWHVVSTTEPGVEPAVAPHVSVVLSDGSAHEAHMPPAYASPCGDAEWDDQAPRSDAEVVNRHDVALLALETPAARHLGYVPLPDAAPAVAARSRVYLLDFPHGDDGQLADGTTWKIRNVTSRLYHDVATESGSSGGAFFDRSFRLLGLHQGGIRSTRSGREVKRGRLVPLRLFYDALAGLVADDIAPAEIWRLDGDRTQLVVGRDLFVSAVAAAAEENGPVRGIRVKRRRPAEADEAGLGFSYRILVELLLRRGAAHVPVALPLDEPVADLVGDLRRRVESAGIALTAPGLDEAPPAGTTLETSARERAHRLAARRRRGRGGDRPHGVVLRRQPVGAAQRVGAPRARGVRRGIARAPRHPARHRRPRDRAARRPRVLEPRGRGSDRPARTRRRLRRGLLARGPVGLPHARLAGPHRRRGLRSDRLRRRHAPG